MLSKKIDTLRKHSEQLNKYTAGLLDSDGYIGIHFKKNSNGRYSSYLQMAICQTDTTILHQLCKAYRLGTVYADRWTLNNKESHILLGRIGKHLRIKATHSDNILWLLSELKGWSVASKDDLTEYIRCSRLNSRWRKEPKHLAWAWMAGYFDGDGHYRVRIGRKRTYSNGSTAITNELKLFVGSADYDAFILNHLHRIHGGSIGTRKDGCRFWQLSLGRNSRTKALRFLKQLRKYALIPKKVAAIEQMIAFHTTRRD